MINILVKNLKLILLLIAIGLFFYIAKGLVLNSQKIITQKTTSPYNNENNPHDHDETDHQDPQSQKRMGIYHYNEGNNLLKQGNFEEAIKNYKMALRHNKDFEESYINISTAYLSTKQFDLALKYLNILKSINPSHPLLHYNFACYYSLLGKTAMGMEALKEAIQKGFGDQKMLKSDPDMENLRQNHQFGELLKSFKTQIINP
jgi:tetratricopeptide (TPR) repeat protein